MRTMRSVVAENGWRTVRSSAVADPPDSGARSRPGPDPDDGCARRGQRSAYHPRQIRIHPSYSP